jgi:TRAP-type C4-dicarboxylate transport system permease small subunit
MSILKWLDDHLEEAFIFLSLSAMSVIIAVQVLMRYVFQSSLSWSEEIARYLFIWLIYVGISYGVKKSAHVSVTALDLVLSDKARRCLKIISIIVFFLFSVMIIQYGWQVCSRIMRFGQESPAAGLQMGLVYMAVPVGFALTCFRLAQKLYDMLKSPQSV